MTEFTFYAIIVVMVAMTAAFQIYMTVVFYRLEQSVPWALLALALPFGLNVLLYQAVKLEPEAGPDFECMAADRRKLWRKVYLFLLLQYMVLFGCLGWFLSPEG
ncbi:hypothetical protein RB620_13115 [Paenibacillus sp. LHD-117]|uniref:hypothetical protein n=1 Tax=Paenibacillus sp. LHD-117 TaxID=3071412 RepID=UPI0027DEEDDD|nr:hypothetical protein [Paenibacillus sp. LHD-117]MDQ6420378.1 hypothetical protein [Paenibacillus sp. LHD-117]